MKFSRAWGMPSPDTFDCEPIKGFVQKYLMKSKVSIDPFARNKRWAKYTNDLNPNTAADSHMDALDFLRHLKEKAVASDLVIFDPPYSLEQLKRSYENIGRDYTLEDGWKPGRWSQEKAAIKDLVAASGFVLTFGWNSCGMGKGWEIVEILLVCHGPGHNDTICMAERKLISPQQDLELCSTRKSTDYSTP